MGRGMQVADYLRKYITLVACGRPDRVMDGIVDSIGGFLLEANVSTVGGMLLTAHAVDGRLIATQLHQSDEQGHSLKSEALSM